MPLPFDCSRKIRNKDDDNIQISRLSHLTYTQSHIPLMLLLLHLLSWLGATFRPCSGASANHTKDVTGDPLCDLVRLKFLGPDLTGSDQNTNWIGIQ